MSHHPLPVFTRQQAIAMTSRPIAARLYTAMLVLLVIGAIVFVAGLFMAPDRVWRAFHANWLFFAMLSSAGVTFVAVQDRKCTRLNSSHGYISYAVFCLKKKKNTTAINIIVHYASVSVFLRVVRSI